MTSNNDLIAKPDVIVVGGGVIGVSTAYFAAQRGARVLIIEQDDIAEGATWASAGFLAPSFPHPLPSPDNIRKGIVSLFDRQSAVKLSLPVKPASLAWLLSFLKVGYSKRFYGQSLDAWARTLQEGLELHQSLADAAGSAYPFSRQGLLRLFITEEGLHTAARLLNDLAEYGVQARVLDRAEVREVEPLAGPKVVGGILYPSDGQVQPDAFTRWMASQVEQLGGRILTRTEVLGFNFTRSKVDAVVTTRGHFTAEQYVLATGSWQGRLSKSLGRALPIMGAKGYALVYPTMNQHLKHPTLLEEHHVAVSPYSDELRLTAKIDICGLDLSVDVSGLKQILPQARDFFPTLPDQPPVQIRRGLRPCTADGLPIIGRPHPQNNVLVGAGHGQKGICHGPLTGRLVADLLEGKPLPPEMKIFAPTRNQ